MSHDQPTRDWILTTRLATGELCRIFHGIDCRLECERFAAMSPFDKIEEAAIVRGREAFENTVEEVGAINAFGNMLAEGPRCWFTDCVKIRVLAKRAADVSCSTCLSRIGEQR